MQLRTFLRAICALFAASVLSITPTQAQSDKTVRFILPVSAGSGVDTITRAASKEIGKALKQTVVVDNQPGAGGITGTQAMIRSAPDGHTLSVISNNHVINPSVYKSMPFDPIDDVTPIAVVGSTPMVIVVNKNVPVKDLSELVAMLKGSPDGLNFGSSGNGTILHLAAEIFLDAAGIKARHIPYKGVAPMVQDLIGGQVEFGVLAWPAAKAHIANGNLKALAVMAPARIEGVKDLPTTVEAGVPAALAEGWFAVIGPPKMKAADVRRVRNAIVKAFETDDVKDAMDKQGNTIAIQTSADSGKFMARELKRYADLVKKAGLKLD